jgi:hypothetical protein
MRPITGRAELELFCQLPYVLNSELADDLESGRRRPEWMWLALRGDRLVARLAWWRRRQDGPPVLLDVLDLDEATDEKGRVGIAAALLRTAMAKVLPVAARPPAYTRFVPPGWRDDAVARRAIEARMTALELTAARLFVERLRLEWLAGTLLAAHDVPRIVASTDLGNVPMARAFERTGYLTFGHQIDMTWT